MSLSLRSEYRLTSSLLEWRAYGEALAEDRQEEALQRGSGRTIAPWDCMNKEETRLLTSFHLPQGDRLGKR